jgi:hypothetical protein
VGGRGLVMMMGRLSDVIVGYEEGSCLVLGAGMGHSHTQRLCGIVLGVLVEDGGRGIGRADIVCIVRVLFSLLW